MKKRSLSFILMALLICILLMGAFSGIAADVEDSGILRQPTLSMALNPFSQAPITLKNEIITPSGYDSATLDFSIQSGSDVIALNGTKPNTTAIARKVGTARIKVSITATAPSSDTKFAYLTINVMPSGYPYYPYAPSSTYVYCPYHPSEQCPFNCPTYMRVYGTHSNQSYLYCPVHPTSSCPSNCDYMFGANGLYYRSYGYNGLIQPYQQPVARPSEPNYVAPGQAGNADTLATELKQSITGTTDGKSASPFMFMSNAGLYLSHTKSSSTNDYTFGFAGNILSRMKKFNLSHMKIETKKANIMLDGSSDLPANKAVKISLFDIGQSTKEKFKELGLSSVITPMNISCNIPKGTFTLELQLPKAVKSSQVVVMAGDSDDMQIVDSDSWKIVKVSGGADDDGKTVNSYKVVIEDATSNIYGVFYK